MPLVVEEVEEDWDIDNKDRLLWLWLLLLLYWTMSLLVDDNEVVVVAVTAVVVIGTVFNVVTDGLGLDDEFFEFSSFTTIDDGVITWILDDFEPNCSNGLNGWFFWLFTFNCCS